MASILESYAESVMDMLSKGNTYQSVSDFLAERNIAITKQSIHSWYSRKLRKIAARRVEVSTTNLPKVQRIDKEPDVSSIENLPQIIKTMEDEGQLLTGQTREYIARSRKSSPPNSNKIINAFSALY